jgi:heme-degrading monooxygenase HmoA
MIVRVWKGRILTVDKAAYVRCVEQTGMVEHQALPGNLGSWVLTRDLTAGYTEVMTVSHWESREAIEAWAGYDIGHAVTYPEETRFLIEHDDWAHHYEVAAHSVPDSHPEGPAREGA